jgi:hypothetical protein
LSHEIKFHSFHLRKTKGILSHRDIVILPFEGQSVKTKIDRTATAPKKATNPVKPGGPLQTPERKQASRPTAPTGKLRTTNIGIKDTIHPPKTKKQIMEASQAKERLQEDFTFEDLEHHWKAYALALKRENKNSLYTTLAKAKLSMTSDYQIRFDIHSVQAAELEREKVALLAYLRKNLRNFSIQLNYHLIEQEKVQVLDSKGTFDKMVEENSSLDKLRKLFNLDIEF